ncbi:DUF2243 domain-containing protein [Gemmata sp.]|uniref:DUF2243 domain-containing protein n=1 Tax=Gemmata sp. TaxID=1914242 RepID=UPI003F6F9FA4
MAATGSPRPVVVAGTLLGIGMGGFVDGIVFHQILQVHHMLTARYPKVGVDPATAVVNLEINMFWDGVFHAVTWCTTAGGLALLWRAAQDRTVPLSTRAFVGSLFLGWGLFNLVEGVIDHHVLHLHHVTETEGHLVWDAAFLASGVAFAVGGWLAVRSGVRGASPQRLG